MNSPLVLSPVVWRYVSYCHMLWYMMHYIALPVVGSVPEDCNIISHSPCDGDIRRIFGLAGVPAIDRGLWIWNRRTGCWWVVRHPGQHIYFFCYYSCRLLVILTWIWCGYQCVIDHPYWPSIVPTWLTMDHKIIQVIYIDLCTAYTTLIFTLCEYQSPHIAHPVVAPRCDRALWCQVSPRFSVLSHNMGMTIMWTPFSTLRLVMHTHL